MIALRTLFSGNNMYIRGEVIPDDLPLMEAMEECGSVCTEEAWAVMQLQAETEAKAVAEALPAETEAKAVAEALPAETEAKAVAEALPAGIEAASSSEGNEGELLVGVPKKGRKKEKK